MAITRVSTLSLNSMVQTNLSRIREQLYDTETEALTGLSVNAPSDAPELMAQIDRLEETINDQFVYQDNISLAFAQLDTAEQALDTVSNVITRGIELAIMFASETANEDSRNDSASEAAALYDEIIALANTDFSGRYLFAGDSYDSEPFDSSGTYVGSTEVPEVIIGSGVSVQVGFDGSDVFQGSVDIFDTFAQLEAALVANDPDALQALIDPLNEALQQVNGVREEIGYRWAAVDDSLVVSENLSLSLTQRLEDMIAADPVETYTDLANLQTAYEAALAVSGSTLTSNLFDFL